jgi:cobalt-zinc-cadmium efflux system outer membrane protein
MEVSEDLRARAGTGIRPENAPPEASGPTFPAGLDVCAPLSREDAVAIALWNNPRFRADLATLDVATADLVVAGTIPNPVLSLLFPWGPKQLEATLRWPVEAIWQRPKRIELAQDRLEGVANSLVETGLRLARDVKIAHAELSVAREREHLTARAAELATEIAALNGARLRAGAMSALAANEFEIAALEATRAAADARLQVDVTRARLRGLLGTGTNPGELVDSMPLAEVPTLERLLEDALAARPDLRVAEIAVEVAGRKLGLAETDVWKVSAVLDANGRGRDGFELGPGLDLSLPIFNQNQGGLQSAQAEMQVAALEYLAVRAQIEDGLRVAHATLVHELGRWRTLRDSVVPAVRDQVRHASLAYEAGQVSYLTSLSAEAQLNRVELMGADAIAAVRRALAMLEKEVGRDLATGDKTA